MLLWLAIAGLGTADAGKPDALAVDPRAGCPAIDRAESIDEHEVRVWWRLVPEAEPIDLQAVEIRLTTPTGAVHIVSAIGLSLKGPETAAVVRGSEGCAVSATAQSELSTRDRDGVRLNVRVTPQVGELTATLRFQSGAGSTHVLDMRQINRSSTQDDPLDITVTSTPVTVPIDGTRKRK